MSKAKSIQGGGFESEKIKTNNFLVENNKNKDDN